MLIDHFPGLSIPKVNHFRSRGVLSPFLALLLALAGALPVSFAQAQPRPEARRAIAKAAQSPRPRLALLIVADQFTYPYLLPFAAPFGSPAIGRLTRAPPPCPT